MNIEKTESCQISLQVDNNIGFLEYFEWEERDSLPIRQHMVAGSLAGIIEHLTILPLDIIKTHQQSSLFRSNIMKTGSYIYNSGGMKKFWRGTMPITLGCIPSHALFFSIYEISRSYLSLNESDNINL